MGKVPLDSSLTSLIRVSMLIILFFAQSSWSIHCVKCKHAGLRCNDPEMVKCNGPEEMCFKQSIILPEIAGRIVTGGYNSIEIEKGCKKYTEGEPQNSQACDYHPNLHPPFEGFRCWCDDQDFCNSSPVFGNNYWMTLILVTVFPFILIIFQRELIHDFVQ